ncbi:carboxypeptidase B-like [Arctopsyche grandis]|uniref:carboxypeptidase B-like n=1 Tax=Arctopsyche grandis TaxID=121162 RepID=UPI00406D6F49
MHSSWCSVVALVIAVAQGAPDRPASPSFGPGYLDKVVFLDDDQPNRTPKLNDEQLTKADEYSNYEADIEAQGRVTYEGAQVWNVAVDSNDRLRIVGNLTRYREVAAWGGDHDAVDFMIKPHKLDRVSKVLRNNNIPYSIVIPDLQQYIDNENPPLSDEETELQERKGHRLTWKQYHRVSDIHGFLDYLATTYPSICSVHTIGTSHEGRPLKVLRISNGGNNKAAWIDGGIHAREWISPATVTYIINQFVEDYDNESDLIRNIDWYFLPVVNPDGYEYTHTIDRLWRKNRKGKGSCSGVDLNRNFGHHWGGQGTSKNPCSEVYAGSSAFSEPESKAIANFIMTSSANFKLYVSYHSYGQYILYPWGYDKVVPPDHADLDLVGKQAAQAIQKTGGTPYKVGASSIVLYPAAGGSDDWAKAVGKIKYSYTIELSDTGRYGFILPANYIIKVAKESLAALRVMASAANAA